MANHKRPDRARTEDQLAKMRETGETQPLTDLDYDNLARDLLAERGDIRSLRLLGKQSAIEKEQVADLRKLVEKVAWQDRLIDELKVCTQRLKPIASQLPKVYRDEEEHVLTLSDIQYGTLLTILRTMGLGEFNTEIARERMMLLAAQIIEMQKRNPVKVLNIWALGDLIEGENIYPGQTFEISRNAIQQTMECGQLIAEFIRQLSAHYKEVRFIGVLGNHGRMGKESSLSSNLDVMTMCYAEALCRDLKNVKFHVEKESWFAMTERFGVPYLLVHGDDLSYTVPGAEKFVQRWRSLANRPFRYVMAGHHHRGLSLECTDCDVFVNGSLVGSSGYSLKKMALGNGAMQHLFVISKAGVVSTSKLRLDTKIRQIKLIP